MNDDSCHDKKTVLISLSLQGEMAMDLGNPEIVGNLLSSAIPRELLLCIERLFPEAVAQAVRLGESYDPGHRRTGIGFARHLLLNQALSQSFDECGIPCPPLKGNRIVWGRSGLVILARIHQESANWDNARRSKKKVELCEPNLRVKNLVAPDFFESPTPSDPVSATAFILTEASSSDGVCRIHIVVTDERMDLRNPVFREPLHQFLQRYQKRMDIADHAKPKLKSNVKKLHGKTDDPDQPSDPMPAA